jgi:hypothetical protein
VVSPATIPRSYPQRYPPSHAHADVSLKGPPWPRAVDEQAGRNQARSLHPQTPPRFRGPLCPGCTPSRPQHLGALPAALRPLAGGQSQFKNVDGATQGRPRVETEVIRRGFTKVIAIQRNSGCRFSKAAATSLVAAAGRGGNFLTLASLFSGDFGWRFTVPLVAETGVGPWRRPGTERQEGLVPPGDCVSAAGFHACGASRINTPRGSATTVRGCSTTGPDSTF